MASKKNKTGLEKLTRGPNEMFGENSKSVPNIFSFNEIGKQDTLSSHSDMYQKNPKLYQFEMDSCCSRSSESNTFLVFSFWTQPKKFDWNFNQKN